MAKSEEYYKQFIGMELGAERYRVRGKGLLAYADALGDHNPKYYAPKPEGDERPDYSKIQGHPAYAATYTIPGILLRLPEVKDKDGNKLVTNIGKLLHTYQEYHYEGCDPLTAKDRKVYTKGEIKDIWLKNEMLWVEIEMISTNKDETKTFCRTTLKGLLRKGGYYTGEEEE